MFSVIVGTLHAQNRLSGRSLTQEDEEEAVEHVYLAKVRTERSFYPSEGEDPAWILAPYT
jgi:hypothetical protein